MDLNRGMWWLHYGRGKSQIYTSTGGKYTTWHRHRGKISQNIHTHTNTIERDKTHFVSFLSLCCPFARWPPAEAHGTVITVHVIAIIRRVCTVVLCGHEDGWSQAGSKGKMCGFGHCLYCLASLNERLMIDCWVSCSKWSVSWFARESFDPYLIIIDWTTLERLKRLWIRNETLPESKFA